MVQVRGVVLANLRRDLKVSGQERRTQLRHELFAGVAVVPELLAAEVAIETVGMLRPVRVMPISA